MAGHGVLRAREAGGAAKPGLLVALRGVQLHAARIDDLPGALECEADVLVEAEGSQQYGVRLHHAGTLLAEDRAAVMSVAPDSERLPQRLLAFAPPPARAGGGPEAGPPGHGPT